MPPRRFVADPLMPTITRDDAVLWLGVLVSGEPYTIPPFYDLYIAPILYEGSGPHLHPPLRPWSSLGHP